MTLFTTLKSAHVNFFAGVPDSSLRRLNDELSRDQEVLHITAACEGGAVAVAAGYWISHSSRPCVYMQNSGLLNALSPLMSLTSREVFDIPLLLVVGWRGKPGVQDEPQHRAVGRLTPMLLRSIDFDIFEYSGGTDQLTELSKFVVRSSRAAILVTADEERSTPLLEHSDEGSLISRTKALRIILAASKSNSLFVTGIGHISREMMALRMEQGADPCIDLPVVGGMGFAAQIAMGIACKRPEKVYCIEGDGSFLMHMGNNAMVSSVPNLNLTHIVLDNGVHASVGGQPTVNAEADLAKAASALGYDVVIATKTSLELFNAIELLEQQQGVGFIHAKILPHTPCDLPRPPAGLSTGLATFRANMLM